MPHFHLRSISFAVLLTATPLFGTGQEKQAATSMSSSTSPTDENPTGTEQKNTTDEGARRAHPGKRVARGARLCRRKTLMGGQNQSLPGYASANWVLHHIDSSFWLAYQPVDHFALRTTFGAGHDSQLKHLEPWWQVTPKFWF